MGWGLRKEGEVKSQHPPYLGRFFKILQTRGHPDEEGEAVVLQDVGPLGTEKSQWGLGGTCAFAVGDGRPGLSAPCPVELQSGRTRASEPLWSWAPSFRAPEGPRGFPR